MPLDLEAIIQRAFEQAFARAIEQRLQATAEQLFKQAFADGSPLAAKLDEKIQEGFRHFVENGIRWDETRAGFQK